MLTAFRIRPTLIGLLIVLTAGIGLTFAWSKVGASPADDVLMLSVENQNADGEKQIRIQFSNAGYTLAAGDYLEYDVKLDNLSSGAGAIDLYFTDGTYLSALTGLRDQNGIALVPQWLPAMQPQLYKAGVATWQQRSVKLPASAAGKTISKWLLHGANAGNGHTYVVYYDNIRITNGAGVNKSVGYSNGNPAVNAIETSVLINQAKLLVAKHGVTANTPTSDALRFWQFNGLNGSVTNKYYYLKFSNAGANSYVFQPGDHIEYDVMLHSPWSNGMGGIDVATSAGYLRGWSYADQNGIGGPWSDMTAHAYKKWYHRSIPVPAGAIGTTVRWWDFVGENDNLGAFYSATYANVKVTNGAGTTRLNVYSGGNPSLNTVDLSSDATNDLRFALVSDNTAAPAGDVLRLTVTKDVDLYALGYSQISNKYAYVKYSDASYKIQAEDRLEYDVKIDSRNTGFRQAVGVDLRFTDNSWLRDTASRPISTQITDQNDIGAHPSVATDAFSGGEWYHREMDLTSLAGKTVNLWALADETDESHFTFTSYFDNIRITRNGVTQVVSYETGNPASNELVLSNKTVSYALSAVPSGGFPAPNNRVATTTFTPDDVPIVSFSVTDTAFGALGNGTTDDTAAFQRALYAAEAAGGGVVFIPSGHYTIKGHLYIPPGVTLRGDWKHPDKGGLGQGTILKAYEYKGNENGVPFITLGQGSTAQYLSVWYPEQNYSAVSKYPATFQFVTYGNQMIRNVTLINSYTGISSGDISAASSQIENVYGTVLSKGIHISNSWDIERWENIRFTPDYWSDSGLAGAPGSANRATVAQYMATNAEGIVAEHIDGIYGNQIYLRSFKTGIVLKQFAAGGLSTGQWSNVDIADGRTGILVDGIAGWGMMVANSSIKASQGPTPYAIEITANFSGAIDQYIGFNNTVIGGTPHTAVKMSGGGNAVASFQNSTFEDWGYSGGSYAFDVQSGNVIINDSDFQKNASAIHLASGVSSASILGNSFAGGTPVVNNSGKSTDKVFIDNATSYQFNQIATSAHVYKSSLPKPPNNDLYNVKLAPYLAAGNGNTDDTAAIQAALNAAGSAGGGTVFLPAGRYKISGTLSVPAQVELRGVNETLNAYTVNSRLELYAGKGNESGTPAVTLGQDAGVRAVTFFYPEQDGLQLQAYPWTIRGNGSGVYVIDTILINSYKGIDFGSVNDSSGYYVRNVRGAPLKEGLYLGKSSTDSWVENVHYNTGYWWFADVPNSPNSSSASLIASRKWAYDNSTFMKFGYNANLHALNLFVYNGKISYQFLAQTEGSTRGTLINTGSDAARTALDIQQVEATHGLEVINLMGYDHDYNPANVVIQIPAGNTGKVRVYGVLLSAYGTDQPAVGVRSSGANVGIQQVHFSDTYATNDYILLQAQGGDSRFENIHRTRNSATDAEAAAGAVVKFYGGIWQGAFNLNNLAGSGAVSAGQVAP